MAGRFVPFLTVKEKPIREIAGHLSQFLGGSVDLVKREEDGIAIVTLNHAPKKNAVSGKMMVDLQTVVEELESWENGKGIILKGTSGNFCSGGDLDFARKTGTPEEGFMMATFMHFVLGRFQKLPLISVAVIEGIGALGGGAELSVACDFRLMSENCKGIGFVHGKMGILPAWGGTNRLVQIVNYRNALNLLSTGKIISPNECLKFGLVDEIISESEDTMDFARNWLGERTKFESPIVKSIKVSASIARDNPEDFEKERRIFAPFWGSPGNQAALQKNIKHRSNET